MSIIFATDMNNVLRFFCRLHFIKNKFYVFSYKLNVFLFGTFPFRLCLKIPGFRLYSFKPTIDL